MSLSFFGEFYLNGKLQVTVSPVPRAPADPCASAGEHWKSAEAIGTTAAFEDHLARYPNCAFAGLARARLEALKAKQAALPRSAGRAAQYPERAEPRGPGCILRVGAVLEVAERQSKHHFDISEPVE